MTFRIGRLGRAISAGLAVWLLAVTASVNALHRHPGVTGGRGDEAACRAAPAAGPPAEGRFFAVAPGESQRANHFGGLCPVCLFLAKYTAERLGEPPGPAPTDDGSPGATCGAPVHVTSAFHPACGPRSPPC